MLATLRYFALCTVISPAFDCATDDPNRDWVFPQKANELHFRKRGTLLGSLSFASVFLDLDLHHISASINKLCNHTEELRNRQPAGLGGSAGWDLDLLSKTFHRVAKTTCMLLRKDYEDMLTIWLQRSQEQTARERPANADDFQAANWGAISYNMPPSSTTTSSTTSSAPKHQIMIEDLLQDNSYKQRHSGRVDTLKGGRGKRQIIAILGAIGLGIATIGSYLFGQSQVADLANSNEDNLEHAVVILQNHETRVSVNEVALRRLSSNFTMLSNHLDTVEKVLAVTLRANMANTLVEKEIRRIIEGLTLLHLHKLSVKLVDTRSLDEALGRLSVAASQRGLKLVSLAVEDIFVYQTSHVVYTDGKCRIIVHVPAIRDEALLQLHEFIPTPVSLGVENHFVVPRPEGGTILAVNMEANVFRVMSLTDLNACTRLLQHYQCPNSNVFDKRMEGSCLMALFKSDHDQIREHCLLELSPPRDYLAQISATVFLLFHTDDSYVDLTCGPQSPVRRELFKGLRRIQLVPGCKAVTNSFIFDGSLGTFGEPVALRSQVFFPEKVLTPELLAAIKLLDKEGTKEMNEMGVNLGVKVRDLKAEFTFRHHRHIVISSISIFMALLSVSIGLLCCLRWRQFRRRMAERDPLRAPRVRFWQRGEPGLEREDQPLRRRGQARPEDGQVQVLGEGEL